MAVIFNRVTLKSYFDSGDAPSSSQFRAFIDAMAMKYTEVVTMASNTDTTITHSFGEEVGIVQAVDTDGIAVGVNWRLDSLDPTNKVIINSGKAYSGVSVTMLTK